MAGHDIIVVGALAGGVEALTELARGLPADLPAAVCVVLHVSPHGTSALPRILQRVGRLPASHPRDGESLWPGRIYAAPPDYHLLVKPGHIGTLVALAHRPVAASYVAMPSEMEIEANLAELDLDALQNNTRPGTPSGFARPDCGGALWELTESELTVWAR